jgi:predicted dinucleotide-binding enzyme
MTTAIIGVGKIGSGLARDLVRGGERVVLAARDESQAEALADELGDLATAAPARDAIAAAAVVVLAIWLDQDKELVPAIADLLDGKIIVDPSSPSASARTASPSARFPREPPPVPSSLDCCLLALAT